MRRTVKSHIMLKIQHQTRKKLAYISPLPPIQSGISYYSAELIPELSKFYDIEVIVNQEEVSGIYIDFNIPVRDVDYFKRNFYKYDRVLYHFGNSTVHTHMFDLIEDYPGVVVLHDFYLSGVISHLEIHQIKPAFWMEELFFSHGYKALRERFELDKEDVEYKYPCNLRVIDNAVGIIVHSNHSIELAKTFYGNAIRDWSVIPQLMSNQEKRNGARKRLSFKENDFVICSFGLVGPTKLSHRILDAWLKSSLSKNENCYLIFAGENHGGIYGKELIRKISESHAKDRIKITGWMDEDTFRDYLSIADVAVQLRTSSRGETSRAVLECMNYSIPTIVNAHGSMAELPKDAVYMISDNFEDEELVKALEELYQDKEKRLTLSIKAKEEILKNHSPAFCAEKYYETIEKYYEKEPFNLKKLVDFMAPVISPLTDESVINASYCIDRSIPVKSIKKHIYIDTTTTFKNDLDTDISKMLKDILINFIENAPPGYFVEPVYLENDDNFWYYKKARNYIKKLLNYNETKHENIFEDEVLEPNAGDIIFELDVSGEAIIKAKEDDLFDYLIGKGVKVYLMIYGLSSALHQQSDIDAWLEDWLKFICSFSGVVCTSEKIAKDLKNWIEQASIKTMPSFKIIDFKPDSDSIQKLINMILND